MMMDKKANFNRKMAELKGIGEIITEEIKPVPKEDDLNELRKVIEEKENELNKNLDKKANISTLDIYANLVDMTKIKLNVDDTKARELASVIVSKSIPLANYGMSLNEAASDILDAIVERTGQGQVKVSKGLISYQKTDEEIYRNIQEKIKSNFDVTMGESELYTKLVKENVRDREVQYRGVPKERIAHAIVDIAIRNEDVTTIQSSTFLDTALRMELEKDDETRY